MNSSYLEGIYDKAFKDRVALLLLETYKSNDWTESLKKKYNILNNRKKETLSVISKLAGLLNEFDESSYVIFKSLKPYPATPNDTDVLFFGSKAEYEKAYKYLLDNGYIFHEWAPQQRTVYDPAGIGKIGEGKKGGTYYIDLYQEVSTDYFAYFNKNKLKPFVIKRDINGILANVLKAEPELAIIMFHNVFPERTFQLEHFYMPLYYLSDENFDLELFIKFIKDNKMVTAIKNNLSLIGYIHKKHFGFVPEQIRMILNNIGENPGEVKRFQQKGEITPYLFSPKVFWLTFLNKATELYCFKSLMVQMFKMLNPIFFVDVIKSLRKRFSKKGVYHLE